MSAIGWRFDVSEDGAVDRCLLAWSCMPSKRKLIITDKLGDVMQW